MAKTKDRPTLNAEAIRPYVERAMTDPALRDDLLAAFVTARGLYGEIANGRGVKGKAERVYEKDFQKQLQALVTELTEASGKIQGKAKKAKKKSHKARNRLVLLTGVTLGLLYNPWTGASTREWIMERMAGGNGGGADEFGTQMPDVAETPPEAASPAAGNDGDA